MAMERSTLIVSALAVMLLALATAPKVAATRSGAWEPASTGRRLTFFHHHPWFEARLVDHRQLMQWVWNYFTDELSTGAEPPHEARDHAWREHIEDDPVILSGKPPLYFQHQGHSQTLVGVERIQVQPGHAAEVSLLLLDPGQDTAQLAAALREKRGPA